MAKINFTIVCDDIRQERGRKHSLMGIYTKEILVPQFPFLFYRLGFFQNWSEIQDEQKFKITVRGDGIKGTTLEGVVNKADDFSDSKTFDANIVLNFNSIQIPKAGRLIFETTLLDDKNPKIYTYEINIKLARPEQLR